jgi:hypothetical protein
MIQLHLLRLGIVLFFALIGGLIGWQCRHRPLSGAFAFVLTLAITAGACWVAAETNPWDDESLRLLYLHSLVEDGDINLANDYRDETWRAFREPTGSFFDDIAGRFRGAIENTNADELYPFYAPADAILNLPGFLLARLALPDSRIAARLGARLTVWLAAAAVTALFYRQMIAAGIAPADALHLTAALLFSPMLFFLGVRLWPEIYAALVLLLLLRYQRRDETSLRPLALGMLVGILPLLHLRYLFLVLPAYISLFVLEKGARARLYLSLGVMLALSPFPLYWSIRHHEGTRLLYQMINYPDPTLTGLAPAFSISYLGLDTFWGRFIAPPAGWILYAPALILAPLIRGWTRRQGFFSAAVVVGMAAQILFYCAASGPVGRYWSPLLPLVALGLAGPRLTTFRVPLMILVLYGGMRALFFAAFPVSAFDSKLAESLASKITGGLKPLVCLIFG